MFSKTCAIIDKSQSIFCQYIRKTCMESVQKLIINLQKSIFRKSTFNNRPILIEILQRETF